MVTKIGHIPLPKISFDEQTKGSDSGEISDIIWDMSHALWGSRDPKEALEQLEGKLGKVNSNLEEWYPRGAPGIKPSAFFEDNSGSNYIGLIDNVKLGDVVGAVTVAYPHGQKGKFIFWESMDIARLAYNLMFRIETENFMRNIQSKTRPEQASKYIYSPNLAPTEELRSLSTLGPPNEKVIVIVYEEPTGNNYSVVLGGINGYHGFRQGELKDDQMALLSAPWQNLLPYIFLLNLMGFAQAILNTDFYKTLPEQLPIIYKGVHLPIKELTDPIRPDLPFTDSKIKLI